MARRSSSSRSTIAWSASPGGCVVQGVGQRLEPSRVLALQGERARRRHRANVASQSSATCIVIAASQASPAGPGQRLRDKVDTLERAHAFFVHDPYYRALVPL